MAGVCKGYFLSSYSARKLGMKTTGNAGGSHNLILTLAATLKPGDDLDAMLQKLGTGLFVTELMGQGVNYVTGDYSRGASGFWVENGPHRLPGARDHHRRQHENHAQGHRGRRRGRLQLRRQRGWLGAGQPDEGGWQLRSGRLVWLVGWLGLLLSLGACSTAHYPINQPRSADSPVPGYEFPCCAATGTTSDSLFLYVGVSGGGSRAAALGFGVLQALAQQRIQWSAERRLFDEIDVVSGVSVAACWRPTTPCTGKPVLSRFED